MNGLIDQVKEGDKVTFEIEMNHKGANAVKVKFDKPEKVVPVVAAPIAAAPAEPESDAATVENPE
jgi:hypothetical protein